MYAIIKTGGKQYSVTPGDRLYIERLEVEEGDNVEFDKVLYLSTDNSAETGTPYLDAVRVFGTVIENGKAKKVVIFKYKAKKDYRKKQGHRQPYTLVEIESVTSNGKVIAVKPAVSAVDADADEDALAKDDVAGESVSEATAVKASESSAESVAPKTENIESEAGKEDVAITDAIEKPPTKRTAKPKADKAEEATAKPAPKRTSKPKADKADADNAEAATAKPVVKKTAKPKADKTDADKPEASTAKPAAKKTAKPKADKTDADKTDTDKTDTDKTESDNTVTDTERGNSNGE